MSSELIILLAGVAVAFATNPFIGYPLPFYPIYNNGASEATKNGHPFVVSLQWGHPDYIHFCSGAIWSSSWIITSARCASVVPPYGDFMVKIGKHDLNVDEKGQQTIRVEKSIIHESFVGQPGFYDIALLKLAKSISFNVSGDTISMTSSSSPSGSLRMLSWGSTWRMYTPLMRSKLQFSNLKLISNADCKSALSNITNTTPKLGSWHLCTAPIVGALSACDSEPGAPLVEYKGSTPYLVGIVTWGVIPCGITDTPLVFAATYYYKTWITTKVNAN